MKVTLKPHESYEVSINGFTLGTFEKGESWNGMLELRSTNGDKLIVSDQNLSQSLVLSFLPGSPASRQATIIQGSPELLNMCKNLESTEPKSSAR